MSSFDSRLYPLSHPQKQIWYIEKLYPARPLHNIGGLVWIKARVDEMLLEEAIHLFIQQHEGLRTRITELEDGAFQYFADYNKPHLRKLDYSGLANPGAAASEWAEAELNKPFELLEQPLFEFSMVRASDQLNGYFVKFHHLVSDGWSIQIMTEQINRFYTKLRNGESVELVIESGYSDYIDKEISYLSSSRFERNKSFWMDKFQTIPESFLQRSANELAGKRRTFWLDESLSYAIKQYVQTNHFSLNTFFLSLILLHQYKITQQSDLIIGTPVLNRSGAKEKRTVGMFTSTIPFRTTVRGEESVLGFINRVNKELQECYYHQRFPYDLLIQQLELRKKGYDQLFQMSVNYYNTKLVGEWEGSIVENEELYCGQQLYSLQLVIKEWTEFGKLEIKIDYQTGDYTDEDIDTLFQRLMVLTEQVVNPKSPRTIDSLHLMSEPKRNRLVHEWNATEERYPKDNLVHQLITEQAISTPERVAAVWDDRSLNYEELNDYADRLAHCLSSQGICKGSIVALLFNHSFETLISMLAVLKSGAAYLPIDVAYPEQRVRYLLEDSQADMLLSNTDTTEDKVYSCRVMRVDMPLLECLPPVPSGLTVAISPEDPAYVMYTSGSTGTPKGVVIKHRGLMNYTWWARKTYYTDERDVAALYSSLAFDLTITSIFPPLINGNTVAIYPVTENEFIIERIIRHNIATVLKLTPAHLSLIKHRDNTRSSIRMLIVGGENLKSAVATNIYRSFGGRAILINEYGPTETVVGCIFHRFDPEQDRQGSVPIGRPIANTQVYLLNNQRQLVPDGVIGELYIAGDGVAAGYLRRSELTEQRFVMNTISGEGTMYKTDDLAIRRADGTIEYLGRSDDQIKLNGYRIELGEIENHLMRVEGVRDAVVIACRDEWGGTALVAYLVAHQRGMDSFIVRQALLQMIPVYMVPQYLVFLDMLPMTTNGKVDRTALPDLEATIRQSTSDEVLNERQEILLKVMKDVLQSDCITMQDNFYRLGGDSIKAIQVMARLNEAGLSLQVKDILSYPIIGELAYLIGQRNSVKDEGVQAKGYVQPTPITTWFFAQDFVNPHHYNQSVLLSVQRKISPEQLGVALERIVSIHDALRLNLDESRGLLRYGEQLDHGIPLEVVTVGQYAEFEKAIVIRNRSLACKMSMHMNDGPLFKAVLFQDEMGTDMLLLTSHHLIVDAISWRILLDDLERMIQQQLDERPVSLQARTHSYQAWAEALAAYTQQMTNDELFYWNRMLPTTELALTPDYEYGVSTNADTETIELELSREYTTRLLTDANQAYNTRSSELLVAALVLACKALNGRSSLIIEMESHGREPMISGIDVSRTVGWFTSIYPIQLDLPDDDIGGQLKVVKEQLRSVPNQGIGYGVLKLASKLQANVPRMIRFNYLGEIDDWSRNSLFQLADYDTGNEQAPVNAFTVLLDIVPFIKNKRFNMSVTYSTKDFHPSTVNNFAHQYSEQLRWIIDHCCDRTEIEFTPSDFDMIHLSQTDLDSLFE